MIRMAYICRAKIMSLYSFYRISKPSEEKIAPEMVDGEYRRLRGRTFWGVTGAYALYYVCRMAMSVVKQPLIDGEIFTAAQLGIIGSAFYFVYAFGKFVNGFIADYCNVRRFMATGLLISTVVNLLMGVLGLLQGWTGTSTMLLFIVFAVIWGVNGFCQSMGAPPGVISLSMPFKVFDLMNTIEMMAQSIGRRRKKRRAELKNRNPEQQALVKEAKSLLMERNNMSEGEAHRYLQKNSMDSGTNMVETAEMVLSIMAE